MRWHGPDPPPFTTFVHAISEWNGTSTASTAGAFTAWMPELTTAVGPAGLLSTPGWSAAGPHAAAKRPADRIAMSSYAWEPPVCVASRSGAVKCQRQAVELASPLLQMAKTEGENCQEGRR